MRGGMRAWVPPLAVACIGLAAILVPAGDAYQYALTLVMVWAVVGSSWNIISGYGGQISFGHAIFFGIGAYVSTLLMVAWQITPIIGVVPGMVAAVAASFVIGWPTFRLTGVYFSLATLIFPLMLIPVLSYLGLQEVSMPFMRSDAAWYMQFDDPDSYSFVALALLVVTLAAVLLVERSRLGSCLLAIRDDQWTAEAAGINAHRVKLAAFAISAAIAAAAGTLYASLLLVVSPASVFGLGVTVKCLMVTLVGGMACVWGPLIGAVILIPLSQFLLARFGSTLPGIDNVVLGLFLMTVIVLAPEGLYWRLRDRFVRPARDIAARSEAFSPTPETSPIISAGPMQHVIVGIDGISKSFAGVAAVSNVTFDIYAGEILGVIGPNGAGKTTVMNLVNGFVVPDRGRIHLDGANRAGLPPWQMCRLGIGRTFQVPRALARRTVRQNVEIGAYHAVRGIAEAGRRADAVMERVGLSHRSGATLSMLSTAEMRKLELARALVGNPRVLLLDEPMAGLAADDIRELAALVRRLRSDGLTIVIIEHTMSAMVALVDRFVVLDQGQVLTQGVPDAVMADGKVVEAYLGKGWGKPEVVDA